MFKDAYKIARGFTLPVIVSHRTVAGDCYSGIGACVVVNDEGWVVTAFHIIDAYQKLVTAAKRTREVQAKIDAVDADKTLSHSERKKRLAPIGKISPSDIQRCSIWWGGRAVKASGFGGIKVADLGVAKLEPWNKDWVKIYPTFKDPTKDFDNGTMLCKLGFPFHHVKPTWDAAKGFLLPKGALPVPLFPIEGIFTRTANIEVAGAPNPPPFPLRWVETSSPGLKGQSGGPTFDQHGTIWAIQSQVRPIPLGFEGVAPKASQKVPQFLNVGLGVHPDTIFGVFKQLGIKFQVSTY